MITNETWKRPTGPEVEALIRMTGYSKAKLAPKIGYAKRSIEKWVTGENEISFCVWFTITAMARRNSRQVLDVGQLTDEDLDAISADQIPDEAKEFDEEFPS